MTSPKHHYMKLFLLILIASLSNSAFSQTPGKATLLRISQQQVDSLKSVLHQKFKDHERKLDSVSKSNYIEALERATSIQTGNNTYYAFIFGGLAAAVTIVAILIGFNFFSASSEFKKNMTEQRKEINDELRKQKVMFTKLINDNQDILKQTISDADSKLHQHLDSQKKDYEKLKSQNEEVLKAFMASAESDLQVLKGNASKGSEKQVENLVEQIETMKKIQQALADSDEVIKTNSTPRVRIVRKRSYEPVAMSVICPNCGQITPVSFPSPMATFQAATISAQCSNCGSIERFENPNL